MIPGYATPAGTRRYAARFSGLPFHRLPADLLVSAAGFGAYRIGNHSPAQQTALRQALLSGINLVDTSSNYGDGASEALIGQIADQLIASGRLQRDELVVVTKGGYLQESSLRRAEERAAAGLPLPDLVPYAPGLAHCLHPDFLSDQIDRSLQRLSLQTVDVYLLHNPEYYLRWALREGVPLVDARAEYQRRLRRAFDYLETAVSANRIRAYGVSSNTFPIAHTDPTHTSLSRLLALGDYPGFRVIQLPLNLLESGAAVLPNQEQGQTVLALAASRGLAVLINRPLNAIKDNALLRLSDLPSIPLPAQEEVSTAVDTLAAAETDLPALLAPLSLATAEADDVAALFNGGRLLQVRWSSFGSLNNWREVVERFLRPRAVHGLQILAAHGSGEPALLDWAAAYATRFGEVEGLVNRYYQAQAGLWVAEIKRRVAAAEPAWVADTLSQTAIRALRATEGVTSVLVGMRSVDYVADVVAELYRPVSRAPHGDAWRQLSSY